MKASTNAKTLHAIFAGKLNKKDGWEVTPVRQEPGATYVRCWHRFELRKEIKDMGIVNHIELKDIVKACDLFGASYYAHLPMGSEGVIEFRISITDFYSDRELAIIKAAEQEGK